MNVKIYEGVRLHDNLSLLKGHLSRKTSVHVGGIELPSFLPVESFMYSKRLQGGIDYALPKMQSSVFEWGNQFCGIAALNLSASILQEHFGRKPFEEMVYAFTQDVVSQLPLPNWFMSTKEINEWCVKFFNALDGLSDVVQELEAESEPVG